MNSYPYMPLYWNDFLSDNKVRVMSSGELGAYVRLLGAAWHETAPGTLPTDDYSLARLAGVGAGLWRKISQRVLACFMLNPQAGRWEQKRMMQEFAGLAERNDRRSDSASKAAAARWSKGAPMNGGASTAQAHVIANTDAMRSHVRGDAVAMRSHCHSESYSESESSSHRDIESAREAANDGGSRSEDRGSTEADASSESPLVKEDDSRSTGDFETYSDSQTRLRNAQTAMDSEILTESQAMITSATAGVAPDFAKMIYGDWFARGGRDGAGVAVPWSRYVAKRWAREGTEWKAGAHRCQNNSHTSTSTHPHTNHGNSDKAQRPYYRTEADRDRARTGIESTAGKTLKEL